MMTIQAYDPKFLNEVREIFLDASIKKIFKTQNDKNEFYQKNTRALFGLLC